jgi:hypothetical protein
MKDNNSVNIYWIDEYCRMLDNNSVNIHWIDEYCKQGNSFLMSSEQSEFEQRNCKFLLCVLFLLRKWPANDFLEFPNYFKCIFCIWDSDVIEIHTTHRGVRRLERVLRGLIVLECI